MSVRLILGPAGSGKTAAALEVLKRFDLLSLGREARLIVPTPEQASHIRDQFIKESHLPGTLGNPICTFYNFAEDVISDAGLKTRLISDVQKKLTLTEVVSSKSLDYFRRASRSPGFVDALDQIIGELKVSMIEPGELEKARQELEGDLSPATSAKIRETAALYQAYQQEILVKREIHDREGVMWRALEILRDRKMLRGYKTFILDGFDRFTGVQKEFIRLLYQYVPEIVITLPFEEEREEVFEWVDEAVSFVLSLGEVRTERLNRTAPPQTCLEHLEKSLFSPSPAASEADDSVALFAGGNIRMECGMVADRIRELVDSGTPPDEIAVVARDIELYCDCLGTSLSEHGIPFVKGRSPVKDTAFARTVCAAMEVVFGGWQAEHVLCVLKSPLVSSDSQSACRTEIAAKRLGLRDGRETWLGDWGCEDDTGEFRVKTLESVGRLDEEMSRVQNAQAFVQAVSAFIDGCNLRSDPASLALDSAVWHEIAVILDELVRTEELVGKALTKEHLGNLLLDGINSAEYRPQDSCDRGVAVLKPESISGRKFRAVFIVGMLEKVFPRQMREDSFFRDFERRRLNSRLDGRLEERLAGQSRERFLFYSAATSAKNRLFLSYPLADSSARDSLPSFYVEEVKKLFLPGTLSCAARDVGDVVLPPWKAAHPRAALEGFVFGLAAGAFDEERMLEFWESLPDRSEVVEAFSLAKNPEAALSDPLILRNAKSRRRMYKPTELENYLACPYRHFIQYTLALEAVGEEPGALNRGTILHDVLYRLYSSLKERLGENIRPESLDMAGVVREALALLNEAIQKDSQLTNLPPYMLELEQKKLAGNLTLFLQKELSEPDASFVPSYFEIEFGTPKRPDRERDELSTERPLVVQASDGSVEICGKIDRVDVDPKTRRALAVDYKLGKAPAAREIEDGSRLQAPIYAMALEQLFDLSPVGVLYKGITKRDRSGFVTQSSGGKRTEEEWQQWQQNCRKQVVNVAEQISASLIPVQPAEGACERCGFESICRIDPWKRLGMASEGGEDA